MPAPHHPRRGSMGYSPRKRARSEVPHVKSWPDDGDTPKIQGFAGYKAGMTHAFIIDYRPTSTTSGKEVMVPVSVVETPPLKVAAVRGYKETAYGLKTLTEIWAEKIDSELSRRLPLPKKKTSKDWKKLKEADEIRVLVYTQPRLVSSVPKKKPELIELRVGGGSIDERVEYVKSLLGKEVTVKDVIKEGDMIDAIAVTKGKGFQGHVKRWGVKLLSHKNSKHRRMIGTAGSWNPSWIQATVPQAGQMGYHQRTEYNKRVLKIGENGEEITPAGGFPNYGVIRNHYLVIHGSIPGPAKRLVRLRDAVRYQRGVTVEKPEITYVSTMSKQGR
ncbi:MAG: 50S ribosomal protein L3 [Thermoplasmata archaeon]|nr:MAG: 50S ribosomal protein L3 [Thermoplasmata archaeon]MCD6468284.1 50S ribosomal protein L3 [Thermoplasmata archaeon]RLF26929.1 MAG: 50S ribosomal protein L3 [Thermoplasmata archaeon]